MKKTITGVTILGISLFILVGILWINHQIRLHLENERFVPPGELVEINGHQLHIYTEGDGEIPLVFMSGGGTSSPMLDFKSLFSLLSDQYQTVIIEKFGYGFSDIVDTKRDIATLLSETREALAKANVNGPYILVPHSMSGLEALYWAQEYPDEIKAIIGLDMAVPAAYEDYELNESFIKLGALAAEIGLTRVIPGLADSDAMKYGTLSESEKELYQIIFYRRTATQSMINEVLEVKQNAKIVSQKEIPDLPMLLFSSTGAGTGWNENEWQQIQNSFVSEMNNANIISLNCSHYVHDIEYEKIALLSKEFIQGIVEK